MQRLRFLFVIIVIFICRGHSVLHGEEIYYGQDMMFMMLDEKEIQLTGLQLKAVLVAVNDFEVYNFPLEKYTIFIMESEDAFLVDFSPRCTYPSNVYGNPGEEKGIEYYISKENFEIIKKIWSR